MLLHGDERGRTQRGNNNAYCQDSALTWIDWSESTEREALVDFTSSLLSLRRELVRAGRDLEWTALDDAPAGIVALSNRAEDLLLLLNPGEDAAALERDGVWRVRWSTSEVARGEGVERPVSPPRSVVLLSR